MAGKEVENLLVGQGFVHSGVEIAAELAYLHSPGRKGTILRLGIDLEARTEHPPSTEGDPEPSERRAITALHHLLGDRVPSITWVPAWKTWVYKGDIPPQRFPSLHAYLDEFPFQVEVAEDYVVVTDPGFGNGAIEWMVRAFRLADGSMMAAVTETDTHGDGSECRLWMGQYFDNGWLDLTDFALPTMRRGDFFDHRADPRILEDYELVGLHYALPRSGNEMHIHPVPNAAFVCVDGKVVQDDLTEADAALICEAWAGFNPQPLSCIFDATSGRFLLHGNKAS